MAERFVRFLSTLLAATLVQLPAAAQELSSDGAYWYEVEITVFSSLYPERPYAEIPAPERNNLRYLPQLRLLENPGDSYRVDFPADELPPLAEAPLATSPALPPATDEAPPEPIINEGPAFSPAVPGSFKVADYARDPFIALDRRSWRFTDVNNRLQGSGEHQVLWHQVWRQPLRARTQTPALQIQGGEQFGDHYQLEGSVRISGSGSGANVDINVWSSSFTRTPAPEGQQQLPEMPMLAPVAAEPVPVAIDAGAALVLPPAAWYPQTIWQLNQTRELGPTGLYYLDHPAMGVLIELRPYILPELELPVAEQPAGASSAFE